MIYPNSLQLCLIDYDNQIMVLSNSDQLKVSSITPGASLMGIDNAVTFNGTALLDNIGFVYHPGAQNVEYKISSSQIDSVKTSYLDLLTNDIITINFRF